MKTGSYIYTDGTRSEELDQSKTIAGILCNVTDTHEIGIMPVESEERINFNEAQQFCQAEGGRCPTIDELTGIFLNKDKINASLEAAGLPKLKESYYWSSTEYDTNVAWDLDMSDGYRFADYKYGNYPYVRPVLAL